MREIMMSGAVDYVGLIRDYRLWMERHRLVPGLILVRHDVPFTLNDDGGKLRVAVDDERVTFAGIPVQCLCSFLNDAAGDFECPGSVDANDETPVAKPAPAPAPAKSKSKR